ncbi:Amino acid/polyamine transporter I [Penicillium maclennaniae]|uniref:Amino acid/polyamine transporter I n=1 Tax=Penicillium maclennaniae TaxID=1343394 RepID=UPI002540E6A5|nr:Amino acid/polyamine transporter I [Penicillium maclennaniae]KAJ5681331.1 Amino acid/polyamine transporter I [Penicillium maclennaniae]
MAIEEALRRPSRASVGRSETGPDTDKADRGLEDLGYTPELARNRSIWQVTFMCFILSSVPYGLSTTLYYPLAAGGPANIIWGWVLVSFLILCVGISLAEITSVYPTAGGVYYQTFVLSPLWCRRVASWICGWSYVAGNITITLAVNFGTALLFIACLNVFEYADGTGITDNFQAYQTFLIFLAITLLTHAISAFGNKWLPWLETFAIFWTIAGLVAIVVCLLAVAKEGRHSGAWVFGHFEPQAGWPAGWSFFIGLLQAAYATSATGMIVSLCEEVQEPAIMVPKAMVGTVIINTIAGLIFLIPVCFVLPDVTMLINLASGQPTPVIFKHALGSSVGAFCLMIPLLVLGLICGVGCVTATSRCTWAFARDGGIPGSDWWKTVNKKLEIPLNALGLGMAVEIVLGLIYFGSTAAYNAFSGVGVIFLTTSYACPIAVSLFFRRREDIKNGSFNFGTFGAIANVIALAWSLLAIPLFCMPTLETVTLQDMNYASVVFVGFVSIAAVWYIVWGYQNYRGPPTDAVENDSDSPLSARSNRRAPQAHFRNQQQGPG